MKSLQQYDSPKPVTKYSRRDQQIKLHKANHGRWRDGNFLSKTNNLLSCLFILGDLYFLNWATALLSKGIMIHCQVNKNTCKSAPTTHRVRWMLFCATGRCLTFLSSKYCRFDEELPSTLNSVTMWSLTEWSTWRSSACNAAMPSFSFWASGGSIPVATHKSTLFSYGYKIFSFIREQAACMSRYALVNFHFAWTSEFLQFLRSSTAAIV